MLNHLNDQLSKEGFQLESKLDMGLAHADLYAFLNTNLCLYPYSVHCYVFNWPNTSPVTLKHVVGYHALATSYTDRFKSKSSRWLRIRIPITISVIISNHGFEELAIEEVRNKQRYQMGNANTVSLIDLSRMEYYTLNKAGFVGGLPLSYANKLVKQIADLFDVNKHP